MMERYHEIVDYNRCLYDCGAKYKMAALEAQLAEATEAARLQVALDRIEAAGYLRRGLFCDTIIIAGNQESVLQWCCEIDTQAGEKEFYSKTPAEAAEQAADWAEQQKVAVVKRCHTCKFLGDVEGGINYCDYHKAGVAAGGLCSQWAERQKEGNE